MDRVPVLPTEDNGDLGGAVTDSAPAQDVFQLGWRPEEGLVGKEWREARSQDKKGSSSCELQGALQAHRQLRQD